MPSVPTNPSILAIGRAVFFLILCLLFVTFTAAAAHTCLSKPETSISSCPPFTSAPSFPFSLSPGCGHPFFQIQCSTPNSVISINDLAFSILRYEPNSSSLFLSPHPVNSTKTTSLLAHPNCSSTRYLSIPNRFVNLSGSPFRVSDASCSRLSILKPCSPPSLPNCSHCPWECKLIKNPAQLLYGCGSMHRPESEQGCQADVLGFLDNFLKFGIQVEWDEAQDPYFSSCKDCQAKKGICGFNSSDPDKQFICFHSQSTLSPPWILHDNPVRIAILCLIIVLTSFLLLVSVATVIYRSRRLNPLAAEQDPTTLFLHRHRSASLLPPVFTYEELEASTNNFDPKRKIGDGGFGSVYLGQLVDGRIVAVKYLHKHHPPATAGKAFSNKSFCNEILILSSINHPNLVRLHGYCSDPRGLLLVYDYVPNGTLADHLHGPKNLYKKGSLTWQVRLDMALQTAMAMEYLHFSVFPPIVHRDITSTNIFIEKDMRIKVGDFGLSRLLVFQDTSSASSGYVWTGPQGTPGYLDPDYHISFRLTEKSDVYSFGVVLLELISGLKAVDQSRDQREMALADLVVSKIQMGLLNQVVDPVLKLDKEAVDAVAALGELAFRCVAADKDDRPDSKEVVEELKRIKSRTRGLLRSSNSNAGSEVEKI
ncbi:putative Kinase [Quillaja saponaria]|uniref:Kinase n=1 Tax=Quillaja saponaria TaxID=32244 RepID=A0AAD7KQQ2_QUISA|nr:putative Kinase [Quillaja saponaria]